MLENLLAYTLFGIWVGIIVSIILLAGYYFYKNSSNKNQEQFIKIYQFSEDEPSMPCIKALLGGQEVLFILDTASDVNYLDPTAIEKMPVSTIRLPKNQTACETSLLHSVAGDVEAYHCEADLSLSGLEFKDVPFRLPSASLQLESVLGLQKANKYLIAGILGHNFLRENQWIIDLNKNSIKNGKNIKTTK